MRFFAIYDVVIEAENIEAANEVSREFDLLISECASIEFKSGLVTGIDQDGFAMTEQAFESAKGER